MKNCSSNCSYEKDEDSGINLDAHFHMQIIYLIIGIVGICGNALVASVLLHLKSMRENLTNTFIINQSIIDGTASIFIVLSTFIRDINTISGPIAQELFCRLWLTNLPIWGIFVSSTYNMVAVTFERYFAIVHPFSHQYHFSRKKALIVISVIWISGPAYNAAYMIPTAGMINGECTVYSIWPNKLTQTAVGLLTVALQYFIPLCLITYAYTHIAVVLAKARATTDRQKHNQCKTRDDKINKARKNVIKTLALVSACFVFCWSLNQIYYTMYNCGYNADFNSSFYHFTVIMVFCNCCFNPIVYALKYKQFQKGFCIIFCCKIKRQSSNNSFISFKMSSESLKSFAYSHQQHLQILENPDNFLQNSFSGDSNARANIISGITGYKPQTESDVVDQNEYINNRLDHQKTEIYVVSNRVIYNTRL